LLICSNSGFYTSDIGSCTTSKISVTISEDSPFEEAFENVSSSYVSNSGWSFKILSSKITP